MDPLKFTDSAGDHLTLATWTAGNTCASVNVNNESVWLTWGDAQQLADWLTQRLKDKPQPKLEVGAPIRPTDDESGDFPRFITWISSDEQHYNVHFRVYRASQWWSYRINSDELVVLDAVPEHWNQQ